MHINRDTKRYRAAAIATLCYASATFAYNGSDIIATYAGGNFAGYSGDDGPAVMAALNTAEFIATDAAGNLYISDSGSHTIRAVDTSGIIQTIAGTGTAGYNGDGIQAIAAQLNYPAGIAFDANGDLYIADAGNNRIRKITMNNGLISTVAGTGTSGCLDVSASSAKFSSPVGLAFDPSGTLYISEAVNRIVRKLSGGVVSSFAGMCGQPVFDSPYGLMSDPSGNLYVADEGTHPYVWKYDSGGSRVTFAGDGANGNTGDGSPADSDGVTLTNPEGLARDAAGNVFISSGSLVRVVTPDGIIHTAVGNGTFGFSGDGGLAPSAELSHVHGLAMNGAGRLFVADLGSSPRIRITGPAAPLIVTSVGNGLGIDQVRSADFRIDCSQCGTNYVEGMPVILSGQSSSEGYAPDTVYEWTGGCRGSANTCTVILNTTLTTRVVAHFTPWYIATIAGRGKTSVQLMNPLGISIAPNGNLYFTETGDCVVRELTASGALVAVAGNGICGDIGDGMPATDAELNFPGGVGVDREGNLYIQDGGNGKLQKVSTDGVLRTLSTTVAKTDAPGLVVDATGTVYVVGTNLSILEATPNGTVSTFVTVDPSFGAINGLAIENSGELIVGLGQAGAYTSILYAVRSANSLDWILLDAADTRGVTGVTTNYGFAANDRSSLFFARNCGLFSAPFNEIVPETCSGYSDDPVPAYTAAVRSPGGIAISNPSLWYVADSGNNAIRKLFPDGIFAGDLEQ